MSTRTDHDSLGFLDVPVQALWGVHTARARDNFPIALRPVHPELLRAFGVVKLACCKANAEGGHLVKDVATAIETACHELMDGGHLAECATDALQGGAGTSTNLAVCEVLANRALQILGKTPGDRAVIHPIDHVNLHQSTNDTYPTALKVAAIRLIRRLDQAVVALQEALQQQEKRWESVVCVGRTEYQDAVLMTMGRRFGAWAEGINRDRWRISKCEERLRVVNLGGTAIGTGLDAPRRYIFRATEILRQLTGLGLARAENLVEATQNADAFAEVSGILKALAVNLMKMCGDLRLLSSGPDTGFAEIKLPPRQAGSSIMPAKVNPVIPEAVTQVAMQVIANDVAITMACAAGSLELNAFLPLIADDLLTNLDLLARACDVLRTRCIEGIVVDEARCRFQVDRCATAAVTALVEFIGYEQSAAIAKEARVSGTPIKELVVARGLMTTEAFESAIAAEAVTRLGSASDRPVAKPGEPPRS
jgi:aspartate ammonia-lyase